MANDEHTDPEFDLTRYYDELDPPGQDGFLGRYSVLAEDTGYFAIPALVVMGVLYALPEDISNWDKDKISWDDGWNRWPENVKKWRFDEDKNWINYIGHPYFGSSYYIYARHYGFSRLESFWYSFAVSTIYEIGIEAWAEPVSIQDMVVTPILGACLAELLLPLEHHIIMNDKKVLNSRILGGLSLFLIDPFGHVIAPVKQMVQRFVAEDAALRLSPLITPRNGVQHQDTQTRNIEYGYGLRLTVKW